MVELVTVMRINAGLSFKRPLSNHALSWTPKLKRRPERLLGHLWYVDRESHLQQNLKI